MRYLSHIYTIICKSKYWKKTTATTNARTNTKTSFIILIMARYFEKSQERPRNLRWIAFSLAWVWGLTIWILLQPNLSNVVVITVIWFVLLWLNGLQLKHLIAFGTTGFVLFMTLVGLTFFGVRIPFMQEYQQQRIANFILPDPNATFGATYNVQQALIAIGSGGLFGKGYGQGTQTQPARHSPK